MKKDQYRVIGKSQPKLDGPLKVTGRSQFTDDLTLPGMLQGKIVRSSVARGKVLHIDTSRAERLPGVKAVVTYKDIPNFTMESGEPMLAGDRVNYVGEEIASIAAVDEDTAYEAAELITVDYEPMPAVFSLAEATAEGAPTIHEGREGNCGGEHRADYGDVEKAFAGAEYVRETEFRINPNHNCFAEHHVVIADFSLPGRLCVWTPNQGPIFVQKELAGLFGLSESDVRVFSLNTGGAFSGRIGPRKHHFLAAILSRKTQRPVKIWCTADEEFIVYRGGGEQKIRIRIGAMKDGTLKVTDTAFLFECGAYMEPVFKGYRIRYNALNSYFKVEAARYVTRNIYTDNPPRRFHHGYSLVGMRFAMGTVLDILAKDLGIDPVDIRLRNAVEKGDTSAVSKITYASCGLKECIRKAAKKSGWKKKFGKLPPYRGIGIGLGGANAGGKTLFNHDTSAALIKIGEDGKVSLLTGIPDMGQGTHTTLAMIAAETLGLLTEDVTVISGDTAIDPFDIGAFNQRGTFVTGNAVQAACRDARKQLEKTASDKLGVKPSALIFWERKVYAKGRTGELLSFEEVVKATLHSREGRFVMGKGFHNSLSHGPAFSFGAQVAEVEVDPETGRVKLLRMTVAHDVGLAINPLAVEGQIDGQVFSGMGQGLFEECFTEKGVILNPSFLGYKLPRPFEMPEVEHIIVETIDPFGPFGAKEVGEGPVFAVATAIAGAVSNAIGFPLTELPITPETVLRAIQRQRREKDGAA